MAQPPGFFNAHQVFFYRRFHHFFFADPGAVVFHFYYNAAPFGVAVQNYYPFFKLPGLYPFLRIFYAVVYAVSDQVHDRILDPFYDLAVKLGLFSGKDQLYFFYFFHGKGRGPAAPSLKKLPKAATSAS